MRVCVLILVLLFSSGMVGCGKRETTKQVAAVNAETFTLNEADSALAPSQETKTQPEALPAPNPVVKKEIEAKAETSAPSSEQPDEKMIQQALKNLGLYAGEIDGKIGPKTKEAIREFQRRNDLMVDGKIGPKTWALLKKALQESSASSAQ